MILFFFFFKQKTAYEMRISDWSSDVCSSDLFHHDIIGGIEPLALMAVDQRGHRTIPFGAQHGAGAMRAGDEPSLPVAGIAVHVVGGRAEAGEIGRASGRERVCQYV